MNSRPRNRRTWLLVLIVALIGGGAAGYWFWFHRVPTRPLPQPDSALYQDYLRSFQVGVAALEIGRVDLASAKLDQAIKLIPEEPAGWANRGIMHLRLNDLDQAARDLKRAKELAPASGEVEALLGLLAEKQGRVTEAVGHFRSALKHDPRDLATLFTLAEAVSRAGGPDSEAEYQRLLEQILEFQPNNLPVLKRQALAAFQRQDMAAFDKTLARLDRLAAGWSADARKQLAELQKTIKENPTDIVFQLTLLDNVLMGERSYVRDSIAISPQPGSIGKPLLTFLALHPASPTPAPADRELTFAVGPWAAAKPVPGLDRSRWDVIRPVWLLDEEQRKTIVEAATTGGVRPPPPGGYVLAVFVANAREVRRADGDGPALPFPGGKDNVAPTAAGLLAVDWDNDFRTDLILAGAGGLRFWKQQADGSFADVSAATGLSAEVLTGDYYGAWAADIEMDGDLDVIVARRAGPPLLLRNNGDGTFKASDVFTSVKGARAFVWADLDNDGAPDAAFLDAAGKLHVFGNDRAGQFRPWPLPDNLGTFVALTAADVNDDGILDLVALRSDGVLLRLSDQDKRTSWQTAELGRWPGAKDLAPGAALFAEDLDNNGAPDLVIAGPREAHVFLAVGEGRFELLPDAIALQGFAALDLDKDGRLDLLGLSAEGQPTRAVNRGKKDYHSITLRPLANPKAGDARINSFAVGGEIEVRAGMLVHKQTISNPSVHFGLGEQKEIDVARIVWPNGAAQWELELDDQPILLAAQRLVGSCPFLFTDDGHGIRFVTDFMWSTPLGMYVNGQNQNTFSQTTDWVKIAGNQLVARDGHYDVRVNANLWETDYFDRLALLTVDHPSNTEIHLDERFFLTPTSPGLAERLHVTTPAKPVAQAWDHHGQDATDLVRAIDGRYLDRCGRGHYQGVTGDHWVEADLGDDAPKEGPILLVARGWIHPTDSSINVAIEQGAHDRPSPLVLEVPDGHGGWKVGRPALGFPAGKDKTMLVRLDGMDGAGVSRRFRLRTNMEIYWDFLGYARELDPQLALLQLPETKAAELRYRGVLGMTQKDSSSPEVPHYDRVLPGVQPWRDLVGYYTRFGDVRELLAETDDRYVIMNAGDEIALRFAVPDGPLSGWQRDFIWECSGWTKDGNPNTRFGTTVLPLPERGVRLDDRPTGRLEDDQVYRRFPNDWVKYHTRFVTPDEFERGLRTFRRPAK